MAASQLSIYNKAIRWLEERKCLSLTEPREAVRYLNDEFSDAVEYCLYQGYWNFGIREVKGEVPSNNAALAGQSGEFTSEFTSEFDTSTFGAQGSPNTNPNFGFLYMYPKPADWVKTFQIADNSAYEPLLRRYTDQNNFWYADSARLYIKYISNDPDYGLNMSLWTPGFVEYLGSYLALMVAPRLKQAQDKVDAIEKRTNRMRMSALASDAMDLPVGHVPYGTWTMSRAPRGSIVPYGSPPGVLED